MPLRAVVGLESVLAYEKTEGEWLHLKKHYRQAGLRMPCCESLAIPKTSPNGTYFFAHHVRGACSSKPESPEHIFLKSLVAKAALKAGWVAITEYRGNSTHGAPWVADVYCQRGDESRVFEIQLSQQSPDEFRRRQATYMSSGMKVIWLASEYNGRRLASDIHMPVFRLGGIDVGKDPTVLDFSISASDFVVAVLSGRLYWGVDPIKIHYVEAACWHCRNLGFYTYGVEYGRQRDSMGSSDFTSAMLQRALSRIGNEKIKKMGLSEISRVEMLRGHASASYSNACASCGALLNNNRLRKLVLSKQAKVGEVLYRPPRDHTARWKLL